MTLTKVNPRMISGNTISVTEYSAPADGVTDATAQVQAAVDAASAAGGGTVLFPEGTYFLESSVTLKSNVNMIGLGNATIKGVHKGSIYNLFNSYSEPLSNVTISGLKFTTPNYPAVADISRVGSFEAESIGAISIDPDGSDLVENISIHNNEFSEITRSSVRIHGARSTVRIQNVSVTDNYFYKGSYAGINVILHKVENSKITNNIMDTNGPQVWKDASDNAFAGSTSAIQIDTCKNVAITSNTIRNASEHGVRVEESTFIAVNSNTIEDSGASAITFYLRTYNCTCTGNTINKWGKIPFAAAIRNYGGTYVIARETPDASLAPLPADPTTSAWFVTWPYSLDDIDTSTIRTYSSTDYTLLPFRGYAAISVTTRSGQCVVAGNRCIGDQSVDGSGLYNYAADFGFTYAHAVNGPVTAPGFSSGEGNFVSSNTFKNAQRYAIYHPKFKDPVNERGTVGTSLYLSDSDDGTTLIQKQNKSFKLVCSDALGAGVKSASHPFVHAGVREQQGNQNFRSTYEITKAVSGDDASAQNIALITVPAESCFFFIEVQYMGSRANLSDVGTSEVGKAYMAIARNGSGSDVVLDNNLGTKNWDATTTTAGGSTNKNSINISIVRNASEANTSPQVVAIRGIPRTTGSGTNGVVVANVKIVCNVDPTDLVIS